MDETLMVMVVSYFTALILYGGWYLLSFKPAEAQRQLQHQLQAMQQNNNDRFKALESEIARVRSSTQGARH